LYDVRFRSTSLASNSHHRCLIFSSYVIRSVLLRALLMQRSSRSQARTTRTLVRQRHPQLPVSVLKELTSPRARALPRTPPRLVVSLAVSSSSLLAVLLTASSVRHMRLVKLTSWTASLEARQLCAPATGLRCFAR
jgi:hypothetical protein